MLCGSALRLGTGGSAPREEKALLTDFKVMEREEGRSGSLSVGQKPPRHPPQTPNKLCCVASLSANFPPKGLPRWKAQLESLSLPSQAPKLLGTHPKFPPPPRVFRLKKLHPNTKSAEKTHLWLRSLCPPSFRDLSWCNLIKG